MIQIDRNRQIDGQPIHPGPEWQTKADAETAVARAEGGSHEVKSGVYADQRVRAALEELTHFKCSYCETSLDRVDWDIEHFRPKGRVKEREGHPGYYWLAYDWINLLPSCTYCNQNRKEKPVFSGRVTGDSGGKLDQFPIADETGRAMDHNDDITREERLLINPCDDDPTVHLAYLPNGEMFAINGSRLGQTSIDVFRLNLFRIKRSRRIALKALPDILELRKSAMQLGLAPVLAQLDAIVDTLTSDEAAFAGMTRYFVRNPAALGV